MSKPKVTPPGKTLARGLRLLEHVSSSAEPVRFSELRELLDGATDATISRLLQSLESEGYVERVGKAGYAPGPRFEMWMIRRHQTDLDFPQTCRRLVIQLSQRSNESAAIIAFQAGRLTTVASHTAEGAVSVLDIGQTLYYERDHAAALAFIDSQRTATRKQLIQSPLSRIRSLEELLGAIRTSIRTGLRTAQTKVFLDQSEARPGISRLAVPFKTQTQSGAIFLCLTTAQAKANLETLAAHLQTTREQIERNYRLNDSAANAQGATHP